MRRPDCQAQADAARQGLEELELLYRTAPVGLCLMDPDLRFVRVNERMAAMNGLPVQRHIGRTLREIVPQLADHIEPLFRRVIDKGEPVLDIEVHGTTAAEPRLALCWLANYYPIQDAGGAVTGVSAVVQDVTELEAARRAVEGRLALETLVSAVSTGFLNLEGGRVDDEIGRRLGEVGRFLNIDQVTLMEYHAASAILAVYRVWNAEGWPPAPDRLRLDHVPWFHDRMRALEIVQFGSPDELPPEAVAERALCEELGYRAMANIPLHVGGAIYGMLSFGSRARERTWPDELLARLRLIGEIFANALIRKRAEEALRVSVERNRTLVEHAPEAIVVLDADKGHFVDANENATRMFKLSRDALLRVGPAELSPPVQPDGRSSAEAASEYVQRALADETPVFGWTHLDVEGNLIPNEVRLCRFPSADGARLVRGSLTDITQRERLERELRQAQKMEAVGRLAGGVAHDFNNLLTAIHGNAELALEACPTVAPELNEIQAASERAAELTRQLLAFSRKQRVQPGVVDLHELVENLGNMLRRVIGEDVRLETRLDAPQSHIEADTGQLEQIIVNLAVNARDAMPRGGTLTIATAAQASADPGPHLVLEVRDTGTGIALDIQPRIFEPFFTTKERGKGTGLGLSTVYGLVAQNKGSIRVESQPGSGAAFQITFPCSEKSTAAAPRRTGRAPRGTETILLVEDETMVRDLTRRGLETYGYKVLEAGSGADALDLSQGFSAPIDLLVTDVIMPGMSGAELARKLREERGSTPVLFVSGYTDDLIGFHGVPADLSLLEKPFSPDQLARKVREVLDRTGPDC